MKKVSYFALLAVMITAGCQPKVQNKPVDINAVKGEITTLMDKFLNAYQKKDANASLALLTEDGLFLGTDPSEFFDKKTLSDMFKQQMASDTSDYHYSVDKREIRVAADGNSALVIEQFTMRHISPKIPIRSTSHVVKVGDSWMIGFSDYAFIPKNEDIEKLNKALE